MPWKPLHEAHAIDRVRVLMMFDAPLSDKVLIKAASSKAEDAIKLGFDSVERAESSVQQIQVNVVPSVIQADMRKNGWVLKRQDGAKVVEEAGFRDAVFGYLTGEYGRWQNLRSRFWDLFEVPLDVALSASSVQTIKLEYWDQFIFDGPPEEAEIRTLFQHVDASLPEDAIQGSVLWHSHAGWFESRNGHQLLINRNLDAFDRQQEVGSVRAVNIYTLVELRLSAGTDVAVQELKEELEFMHRRSVRLFGDTIGPEWRDAVGIKLEDYQA